jgi:nucleotide-binding universal stress UspA family protein
MYQIVVAYDFSASAESALERAVALAAHREHQLLHVVAALSNRRGLDLGSDGAIAFESSADRVQEAISERVGDALADQGVAQLDFYVHARRGRPAGEILGLAAEVGADIIIVGSHGRVGVERLLLGSVSEHVVREARCPVMVVRAKTYLDGELLAVIQHERAAAANVPHRYHYADRAVRALT